MKKMTTIIIGGLLLIGPMLAHSTNHVQGAEGDG